MYAQLALVRNAPINCMLKMVIEKPMQLTRVSNEPFTSGGAFWAMSVENMGESTITIILQKTRNTISPVLEPLLNNSGDVMQHTQDSNKAKEAVFLTPMLCEMYPLAMHEIAPAAIIKNDNNGTFKGLPACCLFH